MTLADRETTADASFARLGDTRGALPVLIAVPHAGHAYPPALIAAARVPRERLEELEDRHADLLLAPALAAGTQAIVAQRARAWIDLNRAETDIDPAMIDPLPATLSHIVSPRARAGLGLVPRRIGGSELWRGRLPARALAERIARDHRPYHDAIAAALARIRARHGIAFLLDCHSMPPMAGQTRIVIGDRHGRSAAGGVTAAAIAVAAAAGMHPARNAPYAGGHTVERHGQPERGIHAIQIEFDRALYLDAALREPGEGLARTAALLGGIATTLAEWAVPHRLAAE